MSRVLPDCGPQKPASDEPRESNPFERCPSGSKGPPKWKRNVAANRPAAGSGGGGGGGRSVAASTGDPVGELRLGGKSGGKMIKSFSCPKWASRDQEEETEATSSGKKRAVTRSTICGTRGQEEQISAARKLSILLHRSLSAYYEGSQGGPLRSIGQRVWSERPGGQQESGERGGLEVGLEESSHESRQIGPYLKEGERVRDVDSGYAWVILLVIFFISASTFGTARAYGLIFERLARDQSGLDDQTSSGELGTSAGESSADRTSAAMPFTLMGAIENMSGPLSGYLLARSRNSWRLVVFAGASLISLAHFLAALFGQGWRLGQLLSMGLMCGLGLSFVTISFFQINNAYFVRYRSTAFGIGLTGAAFGAFYISPLCQYALDNFGIDACYLMLGLILLPNVPLSLLLRSKESPRPVETISAKLQTDDHRKHDKLSVHPLSSNMHDDHLTDCEKKSRKISIASISKLRIRASIKQVLSSPIFHLIWPTQLLFCWFNFVFGMIIVDFGRDRGLQEVDLARLPPIWAAGQLVGRLLLGSLVDLKLFTYKTWTILCFGLISLVMFAMNSISLENVASNLVDESDQREFKYLYLLLLSSILILSSLIALLYLLLNGLIVVYVEQQLQPISIGISSFVGSFFLLPRAHVIGYYRDSVGNYDSMISLFTLVSFFASFSWFIFPILGPRIQLLMAKIVRPQPQPLAQGTFIPLGSEDLKCWHPSTRLEGSGKKTNG